MVKLPKMLRFEPSDGIVHAMNYARQDGLRYKPVGSTCPDPTPASGPLLLLHLYRSRFRRVQPIHRCGRHHALRFHKSHERRVWLQQVPASALPIPSGWTAYGDPLIDALSATRWSTTPISLQERGLMKLRRSPDVHALNKLLSLALTPQQRARATFLWHRPSAAMPGFRCRFQIR